MPDPVAQARAEIAAGPPPRLDSRQRAALTPAPRIVPVPDSVARQPPKLISLFLFPFSLLWRLCHGAIGLFYLLFPFLPRLRSSGVSSRTQTTKRSINPQDTARRFIRTFEEEHGAASTTGLAFHEDSYASALDLAKSSLRFLLVVLQSDEHDDTAAFNSSILTHPDVVAFIRTHNMLVWGGTVADSEAYQVSAALGCTRFPFSALIAHTPNATERQASQGMAVVARVSGAVSRDTFLAKLTQAVDTHTPILEHVRSQRAQQSAERELRREQESAYELSLARDRERARERRAEEAAREQAAREARERADAAELLQQQQAQWRRWRRAHLAPEPESATAGAARISIRTKDGARIIRRFDATAAMDDVYAFVECLEAPSDAEDSASTDEPKGYNHTYAFRLVSPLPRKVYEPDTAAGSVGALLAPSANLVVEAVDEEEEDDEE